MAQDALSTNSSPYSFPYTHDHAQDHPCKRQLGYKVVWCPSSYNLLVHNALLYGYKLVVLLSLLFLYVCIIVFSSFYIERVELMREQISRQLK